MATENSEPVPDDESAVETDVVLGEQLATRGPASPDLVSAVPYLADEQWPRCTVAGRPDLCVLGTHGGAGATTLASLFELDVADTGRAWPVAGGWERPLPVLSVVACARTHRAGLESAIEFARQWASGRLQSAQLLGMVLIDDAPRLTKRQQMLSRRTLGMVPRGWHLPWNEAWRVEPAELSSARVRRTIKAISDLAVKNRDRPGEKQ